MYAWVEAAYGAHMIQSWMEPSRKKATGPKVVMDDSVGKQLGGGLKLYEALPTSESDLLTAVYEEILADKVLRVTHDESIRTKGIFWVNVWQHTKANELALEVPSIHRLHEWVGQFVQRYYLAEEPNMVLDGYGFIINGLGSKTQPWHLDYYSDYSTIFIPVRGLSFQNALQYVKPSPETTQEVIAAATVNPDEVNLDVLLASGFYYTVKQVVAQPFAVIKMCTGTIHRGIANTCAQTRVMFYVSVRDRAAPPPPSEPTFENIKDEVASS